MDEKLSKALRAIQANLCVEYAEINEVTFSDWLPQLEQAFRDDGWTEPQPQYVIDPKVLEQAYKDYAAEPQQPEGELALNPYKCFCKLVRRMSDAEADEDYASHKFDAGRQAQLAHMIAQGYHLPNDCCLGCDIKAECDYVMADVNKLANEIRAIPDTTPCGVRAEKIREWLKEQK